MIVTIRKQIGPALDLYYGCACNICFIWYLFTGWRLFADSMSVWRPEPSVEIIRKNITYHYQTALVLSMFVLKMDKSVCEILSSVI